MYKAQRKTPGSVKAIMFKLHNEQHKRTSPGSVKKPQVKIAQGNSQAVLKTICQNSSREHPGQY